MTTTLQELDNALAKFDDPVNEIVAALNCAIFLRARAPAIRAALELQARVDAGWVLVLREPDAEMLDAAIDAHLGFSGEDEVDEVWKAMLNAAPKLNELFGNSEGLGWKPIEIAPKDGTRILATIRWEYPDGTAGEAQDVIYWYGGGMFWVVPTPMNYVQGLDDDVTPTHWMPIPAPPAQGEQDAP